MTTSTAEAPAASDRTAGEDLGRRVIGAAQWRVLSSILQAGLQFGLGVVLARLLTPSDFGLAAMAAVVVALATLLLDLGLGAAVVQRNPITERHVRVAATLGVLLGSLLAVGTLLIAPLAGSLLRAENLPAVLRAQAILFVLAGVGVTSRALLQRSLRFRQLALVDLVSYGLGYAPLSLVLALNGFGVWSLVVGALLQSLLANTLAVSVARHPWRPLLAWPEARELLRFGSVGALNGAVGQLAFHGDNLVVGRLLGAPVLGLYGRAFSLMMLPLWYVGNTLFSVLFPALTELRNDRRRFARAYLLAVQFVTLVTGPVMVGMAVAAPHLIRVLYGPSWDGVVAPFQIFCAVGTFRILAMPAGAVTHALGQIDAELRRQVVYAIWVIAGAAIGSRWGIAGAAAGVATGILYKYVAMGALTLRIGGAGWSEYLGAQAPGVVVAAFVGAVAGLVRWTCERGGMSSPEVLLAITGACALAMVAGIFLLPGRLRPEELFDRLSRAATPLPVPVRLSVRWALRSHG